MSETIPVFIINLKKDISRRKYMEALCKKHNLQYTFIDAVYGKDLDEKTISEISNRQESINTISRELTKGELGCALSHLSIYKYMIDKNINQAIIFEDDIQINEGFSSIIKNIDNFPKDWELILLGYYRGAPSKEKEPKSFLRYKKMITLKHKLIRLKEIASGSHGYLINLKGARKLTKELNTIREPFDYYTGDDKYINLYAVFPRVIMLNIQFAEDSSLRVDRNEITKQYNQKLRQKQKSIYYKIKKETIRPFKQLLNFFKPFRRYT